MPSPSVRERPDPFPKQALAVTAMVLAVWAGATLGADPLSRVVGETLTRIELHFIAEGLPWTR